MNKVFSFGVDEDCKFFNDEFDGVEKYFDEVGKNFSSVFLDEFDCCVVSKIDLDGMMESLDWDDNGEEEFSKLEKYVRSVESEINYEDVVVLSFCLESDNSWLVMSKSEYEKFMVLVKENEEII